MLSILRMTLVVPLFWFFSWHSLAEEAVISCENFSAKKLKGVTAEGVINANRDLPFNEDSIEKLSDQFCINQAIMKAQPKTTSTLGAQNNKIESYGGSLFKKMRTGRR